MHGKNLKDEMDLMEQDNTMMQLKGYASVPGVLLMESVLFTCLSFYMKFSLLILTILVPYLCPLMWESVLCSLGGLCCLCAFMVGIAGAFRVLS